MREERIEKRRIHEQETRRRRMAARRRKIQRRRNICAVSVAVLLIFIVIKIVMLLIQPEEKEREVVARQQKQNEETTTETITYKIDAPVVREYDEIVESLHQLAQNDEIIKAIYEEREKYPEEVLASLVNNPEMAEFVSGYLTEDGEVQGGITKSEKKLDFPLFTQWDPRWGYVKYGESNIGMAGCGPTCLSMVVYALTRNEEITPDVVALYSDENGFYVSGTGTAWSLMTEGASHFGVDGHEISLSQEVMEQELDYGNMIICAVGQGDFTTSGHFIVIYGYDENGFYVNDPNCIYRSGKAWKYDVLYGQIKNLWSLSRSE